MFGSLGVTELILILVIVLIVFGAGKLPKIGEGVGKALKGFKKEIHEAEPIPPSPEQAQAVDAQVMAGAPKPVPPPALSGQPTPQATPAAPPPVPPQMGPAATPGTTAYMVAQQTWKPVTPQPVAPPAPAAGGPTVPAGAPAQPSGFKAVVNKEAVKRVMAQQAAMKGQQAQGAAPQDAQALEAAGMVPGAQAPGLPPAGKPPASTTPSPQDLQSIGSGIGDALRTFREAANDVRRAIDPSMHTIKAEVEAAQKELQASIDYVKESPKVEEPPPKSG
jgi:TatA/E family protein of Tat protein translocase